MTRGLIGAVLVFVGVSLVPALAESAGEARVERFKQSADLMKSIFRRDIRKENFAKIASKAEVLATWGEEMTDYFPSGSDGADDGAKAEIWQNFDDFSALADDFAMAARALEGVATEGADKEQVKMAFRAVGASCKACHEKYRIKK